MAILTIEVLKKILENVPDDYEIRFDTQYAHYKLSDKFEIDVEDKKLIFKKH